MLDWIFIWKKIRYNFLNVYKNKFYLKKRIDFWKWNFKNFIKINLKLYVRLKEKKILIYIIILNFKIN